jgi:subtilisin-like proprotein convertase family protein
VIARSAYIWHCLGRKLAPAVLSLALAASAQAGLYTYNYGVNAAIPDNSIIGITDSHTLSGLDGPIADIQVTLNISGGYNGDLYGYLRLGDSPLVVLINRVGVTSGNPDGYANSGFLVTLTADSAASDIHFYQNYTPVYNSSGQLTGTWQADGRTSPLDTARGSLSYFDGLNANDTWTLFFADRSTGDQSTLIGWSLAITTVPEPVNVALISFGALAALLKLVSWRRRASHPAPTP